MAPLANDPIMSGRLIQSLRHLECQNPFIISDSIGTARMVQKFRRSQIGSEERRSTVVLGDRIIEFISVGRVTLDVILQNYV